ncbi:Nif3-like dinuclear metal center hexameric protein [Flavobacterium sp.]|uniref:Nif3-like dinuclear metal center hexameric protein n=1 Tax=Flavobacterium sp. TaxID=239 RepID=UPI0026250677|nr:Nif3-like dinuclear metal center hexameric protein [Flavobacterium sp.]
MTTNTSFTLRQLIPLLEELTPTAYAEDFDNVGLLVGDPDAKVSGIIVCHDALEPVIDEAVTRQCNVVVCFHPILFSGIKKITGKNYVERAVRKAIKNDIAIYAVHTALDNHPNGVNKILCDALGIIESKVLIPKNDFIQKLVTYAPVEQAATLRDALFDAGAGRIGNYENCSFNSIGIGTYQGNDNSNPVMGQRHEWVSAEEQKIEVTFEKHLQKQILQALFKHHCYEEVGFEVYNLQNTHQNLGLGRIGKLPSPRDAREFLLEVKEKLQCGGIRHSAFLERKIERVAVLGGSGSFAIKNALAADADLYITSDLKYHNYFEAEGKMILADVGHFESERFTKNYIVDFLKEKITNFAPIPLSSGIQVSEVNTNPVKYL